MNRRFYYIVFLASLVSNPIVAQEDKTNTIDSTSIRKEYILPDPKRYEAYYDVHAGLYYLYPKIGNTIVGTPVAMSVKEYQKYVLSNQLSAYYKEKSTTNDLLHRKDSKDAMKKGLLPSLYIKNKIFETIFGGNKIEIIPQGFASFDVGGLYQRIENPIILPQNRQNFSFNIQQRMQLSLLGKVGENLRLKANYDTQSGFAFENRMNLVWKPKMGNIENVDVSKLNDYVDKDGEDGIIRKVEFGNVNMPLSTGLIRGSESLFGLKTDFKLGKTTGTLVLSQQQGEARNVVVQGGGTMKNFKINASDYEDNQHYFLGHYFLNNYDNALAQYPMVNSKISINRIEVWVLEQGSGNLQNQKSIVGIRDLGEGTVGYPQNDQNNLYQDIVGIGADLRDPNLVYNALNGRSFPNSNGVNVTYQDGEEFVFNRRAKKLNSNEYTFDSKLGYISLNQRLNDNQLLAVSYSYTIAGDPKVYKVGEFSEESPVVITKLLKPNNVVKTTSPMWDLMMKNIYSIDANQVSAENFMLNIYYRNPQGGKVNYLPIQGADDKTLLQLLGWDRLDKNNDLYANSSKIGDGLFDFVPKITINPENGKLIFTKVQPFGNHLREVLGSNATDQYVFSDLYSNLKSVVQTNSNLAQRYTIEGRYKGGQGSGISLGAINVPQGSVKVTANGVQLVEGQDYTVDYMLGQVNIINEQVKNSGQAINISLENQLTFNTQRKRFLGLNLERKFNDNLIIGGTLVNYSERPLTHKVNFGQEAVNNTITGFNLMYNNELPILTRLTDKLPLVNTETPSNLSFKMETAYLIPGANSGMGGQSYIDDFEQTSSKISLKEPSSWVLASKPQNNTELIYQQNSNDNITSGNGRGLLSWYNIDPRFYNVGGKSPNGINAQSVSNHASRRVRTNELLNNKDFVAGEQTYLNTFDITYYPTERGPYNFNTNEQTSDRWSGLMRPISVSNFVSSNIEYVEFWLMDPYADNPNKILGTAPKLRLQLGNISEDILRDGRLQYENGLPSNSQPNSTSETNWGKQPNQHSVLYAFSTEGEERAQQDVGFDGLNNQQEAQKFGTNYVNPVTQQADPAGDDFVYYLSNQFRGNMASSIVDRYRYFRNPDGNSQANTLEVSSQIPDTEDVNRDYNLDQNEAYNQYTIDLSKGALGLNKNFIVDEKEVEVQFENGQRSKNKWYLFRIPVGQFDAGIPNSGESVLNNVRFARILLDGIDETTTLRFGSLDLVRSDWRKYTKNISADYMNDYQDEGTGLVDNENFFVGSINLEENGAGTPPYVLPPGIDRQVLSGNAGVQRQNESSLYLKVNNLAGNTAKAVVRNANLDMRRYKKLGLFLHAEDIKNISNASKDADAKFFIRLGSDITDNYYEYETSLKYTPNNARSPLEIWNEISLDVEEFVKAKSKRDKLGNSLMQTRYHYADFGDNDQKIFVKGRPSLGNITSITLGVRNKSAIGKSIVLWVNEIRLSEIDNKGGYATNTSLNFNLGDLAYVNANFSMATSGFGSIEQKPAERSQTNNMAFGVNTNVNLDKFLPEKSGIKIPINYSYTQEIEDPKYNPLDNDVEFSKAPNKDELKKVVRTYRQRRSVGVVNMRKERVNDKAPKFYDLENISVTAIYEDNYFRDIYTKKDYDQRLRGNIDYNYTFKPMVIKPFNKIISDTAKSAKYFVWLKDFNFNPIPTRFSFRTEVDRQYNELQYRNIDAILSGNIASDLDIIKNRAFYFGWQYNLGFNFTKSLKMEINSATRTINDQQNVASMGTNSIFSNPFRAGRPVLYNHRVQVNYRVPFSNFPYLDFITAEAGYGFQYNWNTRSSAIRNHQQGNLGNVAQNTNTIVATASVDIPNLLGKFKYFTKVNEIITKRKQEIDSLNNAYEKRLTEKRRTKIKPYKFKNKLTPLQAIAYSITSVKQLNVNYNETNGTMLPGVLSAPNWFGYGQTIGGPTYEFLLGSQADIRRLVIENGWVSNSEYMTEPFVQNTTKTLDMNIQITPMNDLRIDLNSTYRYNQNYTQSGYNYVDRSRDFVGYRDVFGNEMISHSKSVWTFPTTFKNPNEIYRTMLENARVLSQRVGDIATVNSQGFTEGYGIANAYILVPAFQSAMEGKSIKTMKNPTKVGFSLPNWRLIYSGLRNIPLINSQFSKFDILHSYTSTYTNAGIQTSMEYFNNRNTPSARDVNGNRYNPYIFGQVGYVEAFQPLIGADMTMRNNMQLKAQINKDRTFLLSTINNTLNEEDAKEYVFGFGYILKDLKIKFNVGNKKRIIKSDLNIRGDISIRDTKTTIRNILMNDSQITGGQTLIGVKFSADYNMSENLNIRFFYDQLLTRYKISTAFPLSTVRAGISATFTFGGNTSL